MKLRGKIFRAVCIMAALLCGVRLTYMYLEYRSIEKKTEEMQSTYAGSIERFDRKRHFREPVFIHKNDSDIPEIDFEGLMEVNPDKEAWIYIPETDISFPILKGKDNQEYLFKDYTGAYAREGSIFSDYRITEDFNCKTIIYGHNMHNGAMFGELDRYEDEEYLKEHDKVYIFRPGKDTIMYRITEAKVVSVDDDVYDPYKAGEGNIMILSTCTGDSNPDKRFILLCTKK